MPSSRTCLPQQWVYSQNNLNRSAINFLQIVNVYITTLKNMPIAHACQRKKIYCSATRERARIENFKVAVLLIFQKLYDNCNVSNLNSVTCRIELDNCLSKSEQEKFYK
ncbi:MAG: hypothetical protein A2464_01055 [Deltaproteobacteria bacterium RIFOXYC2_FULL_48_10]|nr:MAG: hypothetical protein A2464_01055 [Deltaproteobacteria bacterium RIFOXYC2_FULL_48_10]